MAKKRLPEFPTDWHQKVYGEGLERELLGYQRRQEELRAIGLPETDIAWKQAVQGEEDTLRELRRLGLRQQSAEKRPRTSAKKETR